jgi:hypothetical protein
MTSGVIHDLSARESCSPIFFVVVSWIYSLTSLFSRGITMILPEFAE